MSIVTLPRAGIPIGNVSVNGQQVPVALHPEFQRYFETLFVRVGGATGSSSEDLKLGPPAGAEEAKAYVYALADDLRQQPQPIFAQIEAIESMISELSAVVAELSKAVDAINQGVIQ